MNERTVPSSNSAPDHSARAGSGASPGATNRRRRLHPDQKLLLFAAFGVIVGSFMPWVSLSAGAAFGGFAGAGLYTFYTGVLGVGGGLVPNRNLAIIQGLVMGVVAIGLTVWQVARLIRLVGLSGWFPGAGLIFVFASGCLSLLATYRIWRYDPGT